MAENPLNTPFFAAESSVREKEQADALKLPKKVLDEIKRIIGYSGPPRYFLRKVIAVQLLINLLQKAGASYIMSIILSHVFAICFINPTPSEAQWKEETAARSSKVPEAGKGSMSI